MVSTTSLGAEAGSDVDRASGVEGLTAAAGAELDFDWHETAPTASTVQTTRANRAGRACLRARRLIRPLPRSSALRLARRAPARRAAAPRRSNRAAPSARRCTPA